MADAPQPPKETPTRKGQQVPGNPFWIVDVRNGVPYWKRTKRRSRQKATVITHATRAK